MAEERKPFAVFLQEQRRGGLHGRAVESWQELVRAVEEHRKGGTLTLTVKVAPFGDGTVAITDKVALKAPEGERGSGIFSTMRQGYGHCSDPRQLEIRDAVAERRAAKAAGDE